jgi:hypothetical protein
VEVKMNDGRATSTPSSDSDELITGQYIKTLPGVVTHVMLYLPLHGSEKHLLIAVVFRSVRI